MCSGQALTPGPSGAPQFDREKCVHGGACLWNCRAPLEDDPSRSNIAFTAGAGGLHATENQAAQAARQSLHPPPVNLASVFAI